ncbi:MAG: pentapeptide repeat-containing protein [Candidatus Eisenbacteria bacterium]|uniref:Pentapeptide repeat-containing protein n=1 Tax=Eiseniibacteriota bacterium TaxID=2212470 RepID=A0A948RXF8_UNCEI|nr:pentapeptide repeat-containing protein [Candidatus Eisenbacteria bacterium]MBU1948368.1 pentapeptide repeat-containing protein [Candidatus Eisenbacteria bacterium]MBU2692823.1 pentapeptide repeat-containing protein [Candidatus Eisenbacteria bacterium]
MNILNETPFQAAPLVGRMNFPGYSMTFIVKGTFDITNGGVAVPADDQAFPTGDEPYPDDEEGICGCRYESDFAFFKPRADLLLAGKCHTSGKRPQTVCRVTFQVGDRSHSLNVIGNRHWRGSFGALGGMSDPEPFTEMELRYESSFGGEGFKANPTGKGNSKRKLENGKNVKELPNIEDPRNLISSPSHHPDPAGFGALGRMWELRASKLGTYKGNWLKERWPWFPKDFDWSYFNAAPPELQLEGYLRGDEKLYFENLHPEFPQYRSQLPGLKIRTFLNLKSQTVGGGDAFSEIPMNLDTLWVDMEAEKLVLVWRGVAEIQSDDYEEIRHIIIATENLSDERKPAGHYQSLLIEPSLVSEMDREDETDSIMEEPPGETAEEKDGRLRGELGSTPASVSPMAIIVKERAAEEEGLSGRDLTGIDLTGIVLRKANLREVAFANAILRNCDLSEADLTEADLTGADLSNANLSGALLKDADLTHADLTKANLSGAILNDAIFEQAKLQEAVLNGATALHTIFCEADLARAKMQKCDFQGADFSCADLSEAEFQGSNLKEASVEGASGRDVNMSEADLTKIRASEKCDFTQGLFINIQGFESIWEEACLNQADFTGAQMERATFEKASLANANFLGAVLKGSRFIKASLCEAKMQKTNLFQGSLEKADLTRADFSGSNLYEVELLDAVLSGIRLDGANLKMTKLAELKR